MAISKEQLEYAKTHFKTLFPDLLSFPERHSKLSRDDVYGYKNGNHLIDTEAIGTGKFDLLTTVESTWDAFRHYELVQAQKMGQGIPKESLSLMHNVATAVVEKAYLETIGIIVQYRACYQPVDLTVIPDSTTTERMRPGLFLE